MRILFAASEMAPWMKTGGLGDVVAALPPALMRLGAEVKVLLPAYPGLLQPFANAPVIAQLAGLGGELPDATLREARTPDGVSLLLLDCPACYTRSGNPYLGADGQDWPDNVTRFGLLSRVAALLASGSSPLAWKPEVLHCHDWQSALAPAYLHYLHADEPKAGTMVTIHNLAFQGKFPHETLAALGLPESAWSMDGVEFYNALSFLKAGIQFADWVATVSPTYAREIQTDEEGMGMAGLLRARSDRLSGILNGIDEAVWNPTTDELLPHPFSAANLSGKKANKRVLQERTGLEVRPDRMLLGIVSRLTHQKGLDLVPQLEADLLSLPIQIALLGSGEATLEAAFADLAKRYPGRVAVRIGFDEPLAHLIEAGSDAFLMPSRFEPCGLNQMYSLAYGTPPIVRATGGLADTVVDLPEGPVQAGAKGVANVQAGSANGFVFQSADAPSLLAAVRRACAAWQQQELWRQVQRNGMETSFGWAAPAGDYLALYERIAIPAA